MGKKNKTVGPATNITADNYKGEPSDHPVVKLERLKRLESERSGLLSIYSMGYYPPIHSSSRSFVNSRPSEPYFGNGFFGRITSEQWKHYAERLVKYYEKEKELDQEEREREEERKARRDKERAELEQKLKPIDEEIKKLKAELKLK